MAAPRFHVPLALVPADVGREIDLPEATTHHAVRVLRLAAGDAIVLFTGMGGEFAATIVRIDRRGATARLTGFASVERESPLAVTLVQAVAANDAMDYAVRKAVELGAAAIAPVMTARSVPLPVGERGERRLAHWRQIATAACEQCGRNRVPEIAAPVPLAAWLAEWTGAGVVLDPEAAQALARTVVARGHFAALVGPEGGLTEREIASAKARGLLAVRLGPRVLRTETAGVAVLAVLQALAGDLLESDA